MRSRRGFTLLTTLWILSVASIAAMAAALSGRTAVDAGRNRVNFERAHWRAVGCARRAQAAVDAALSDAPTSEGVAIVWRTLGRAVASSPLIASCDVALEAAGTRIDLNSATPEMIVALLAELGYDDQATAMADILADRDTPLADVRELARMPGFAGFEQFDSLITVEPGRISLATAPSVVLQTVPGISTEAADSIVGRSMSGEPFDVLLNVVDVISESAASELIAHYVEASRLTTADPDAWVLSVRATTGLPPATERLEWRLARIGRRVTVVDARSEQ
ncbi:MAG TPA: hypothetical protein VGM67_05490 [Gemmatimonadaceae bacterium]|jgi:type II secretory pathway component PulK